MQTAGYAAGRDAGCQKNLWKVCLNKNDLYFFKTLFFFFPLTYIFLQTFVHIFLIDVLEDNTFYLHLILFKSYFKVTFVCIWLT